MVDSMGTASCVSGYLYLDSNRFLLRVNYVLMETYERVEDIDLMGGHPALDLVNTVGGMLGEEPRREDEHLRSYDDLLALGLQTGTLSERAARRLRRAAGEDPAAAEAAVAAALETRALVDSVFRPFADGSRPAADALDELSELGARAMARGRLVDAGGESFEWSWEHAHELEAPLWPLAHSAVELVTGGPLERVSCCGRCRWLFLDATKNHSRRWCSTEGCGTDAKMERYVARRRERRARNSSPRVEPTGPSGETVAASRGHGKTPRRAP
jgi:predicted RNA-binding Zn ribbon-like protein